MSKYRQFDNFLISFVENLCHKLQKLVGINNFMLAKMAVPMWVIMNLHLGIFPILLVGIGFIVSSIGLIFVAEESTGHKDGSVFLNPLRTSYSLLCLRIFFSTLFFSSLVFSLVTSDNDWLCIFSFFVLWLLYVLVVCTPLPPGASRLRQWLTNSVSSG